MNVFQPERLRELRERKSVSQRALGAHLGISDKAVSKWEMGLSSPSAKNLIALGRFFDVATEYFYRVDEVEDSRPKGMESLTELYRIGRGPSSSHTIGPERAVRAFMSEHPYADEFKVVLYGSLAKTGKGHGTDVVVEKTFAPVPVSIEFNVTEVGLPHPNTMDLVAYKAGQKIGSQRVLSLGGGAIHVEGARREERKVVYELSTFADISEYCNAKGIRLWEYVAEKEGEGIWTYLAEVWKAMKVSVQAGLNGEGVLPGGLNVARKAKALMNSHHVDETPETRENRVVCAYAFAVSEQNASGETIVTAPTCGAAGVLPAVLLYQQKKHGYTDIEILRALATAGLMGNLIKTNGSISGAECGCQAEVGSACAMASAALAELHEFSLEKIEYASEIAIEHHLGLTCDPICGLVQIPCIERNAVAAMRAINAVNLSGFLWGTRKISFDGIVATMRQTGLDMHCGYKETAEAGLAKLKIK